VTAATSALAAINQPAQPSGRCSENDTPPARAATREGYDRFHGQKTLEEAMTGNDEKQPEGYLRVRLGLHDTHYASGLIPAATILRLFADCSSELGIRTEGTDGYLAAYEKAEFFKPVYAGDYIEIRARRLSKGNRSRRTAVEARRAMESKELGGGLSGGIFHDPPELVAQAIMIAVRPRETPPS
jgi:3-aminobutyryl-CoA ammonia-lyase